MFECYLIKYSILIKSHNNLSNSAINSGNIINMIIKGVDYIIELNEMRNRIEQIVLENLEYCVKLIGRLSNFTTPTG
jgi:hypothetical protein